MNIVKMLGWICFSSVRRKHKVLKKINQIRPGTLSGAEFLKTTKQALEIYCERGMIGQHYFLSVLYKCLEFCGDFRDELTTIIVEAEEARFWAAQAQEFNDNVSSKYAPGGWPRYDILDKRFENCTLHINKALSAFMTLCHKVKRT